MYSIILLVSLLFVNNLLHAEKEWQTPRSPRGAPKFRTRLGDPLGTVLVPYRFRHVHRAVRLKVPAI